jgi:hypothetical protein
VVIRHGRAALGFAIPSSPASWRTSRCQERTRRDRWFNTAAGFNRDTRLQLGSNVRTFPLRFSGVRGDGQASWDFTILKNFPIGEKATAQFRAEVYNAWNHTNFNNPNTAPANTAFGRITGTSGDARNWQFALKLTY